MDAGRARRQDGNHPGHGPAPAEDDSTLPFRPSSLALPVGAALRETRQEFAVPILSRIPYVNRLFKTVGYGRETEKVFLLLTPRVIVEEDVEGVESAIRATG